VSGNVHTAEVKSTEPLASAALLSETCRDLALPSPDIVAIKRYLGYRGLAGPSPRVAQRIMRVVSEARPCLHATGVYSLYGTRGTPRSLSFGDVTISGNIGEFMAHADRVAVFVATVGEAISERATAARRRDDDFDGCVLDALGSWAAEAAADALMERVQGHLHTNEALTLRYSPGYCGMDITEQRQLFRLVPAASIGVNLLPSSLMYPLKSISGIVGLGPTEAIASYLSACDHCNQVGCHMRR